MKKYLLVLSSVALVSFGFGILCSTASVPWLRSLVQFPVEEVILLSFLTSAMLTYILVELEFIPVDYLLTIKFQEKTSHLDFLESKSVPLPKHDVAKKYFKKPITKGSPSVEAGTPQPPESQV